MPTTPRLEKYFTAAELVCDIIIGMSDGLTVPFVLAAGSSAGTATNIVSHRFIPAAAGESVQLKFSADLAHILAFPLGWLSNTIGQKSTATGEPIPARAHEFQDRE